MNNEQAIPQEFIEALNSLKGLAARPQVHLREIPAPNRLASYTIAMTAEINTDSSLDPDCYLGDGRFVVLYEPDGQPAWNGNFRVITQITAKVENEVGDDPFLGEVTWSWLLDALTDNKADLHSINGSVTRVISETFGDLQLTSSQVDVEIRASWTPTTSDIAPHAHAWIQALCSLCGLQPLVEGVANFK